MTITPIDNISRFKFEHIAGVVSVTLIVKGGDEFIFELDAINAKVFAELADKMAFHAGLYSIIDAANEHAEALNDHHRD